MDSKQGAVVAVGSLNVDFVAQVGELPKAGETIAGRGFVTMPGGKGANQACAAGRLGAGGAATQAVWMVGCVGQDVYGQQLIASLHSAGVDTSRVKTTVEAATGVAFITVEESGQNQIVVVAGANQCLRPEEATDAINLIGGSHLLLQLESPLETVEAAARTARARGMTVILDPAPARPIASSLLAQVDILTPNESEALTLLGLGGDEAPLAKAPEIARRLLALGPRQVVLKLGEKGAFLADGARERYFAARPVKAVDTTAAGDCFNGALAIRLSEGKAIDEAIEFAIVAAALAVTRPGAQASLPSRAEVEQFDARPQSTEAR
ncbi:MAG: ribokinase [Burkholderiales bacterium]